MYEQKEKADKELPSLEYSLKSISWHLKVISEELKKLNEGKEGSAKKSWSSAPF
jgi:hypothetical protein